MFPHLHPGDRVLPRGHSLLHGRVCFIETSRIDGERFAWILWDDDSIGQCLEQDLRIVERAVHESAA